jgi:two-component system alkaline phosphatase synthesis response regulator PhoP
MKQKILLVEDDEVLSETIREYLEMKGFDVALAVDGLQAIEICHLTNPRVILLDIILPGKNGYEVAMEIRKFNQITPILFMTGTEKTIENKINAYGSGGVDFIEKPFQLEELYLKINVWLNTYIHPKNAVKQYQINDKLLSLQNRELVCEDIVIALTDREFIIMTILLDGINQAVSRRTLMMAIWKSQLNNNERMLNNYISELRKKLSSLNRQLKITLIYNVGYTLATEINSIVGSPNV